MKKKMSALLIAAGLTIGVCSWSVSAQDLSAEPAPQAEAQTQTAVLSEEEQKAEEARAFAENLIFRLASATEEELDELRDTGNASVKVAIANWDGVSKELGTPVEIISQDVKVSEDGKNYTIVSNVKYDGVSEKTSVVDTVELNVRTKDYTIDFEVFYPKSKLFGEAALNTIMGVGIVFLVLLFLSWLIGKIHWIPDLIEKRSKKADAASPAPIAPAPVVSRMNAAADEGEIVNDGELIAVIAAAIAAYEGTTVEEVMAEGLVVRTIKKSNRENWLRA